jgi:hypothetical protein
VPVQKLDGSVVLLRKCGIRASSLELMFLSKLQRCIELVPDQGSKELFVQTVFASL